MKKINKILKPASPDFKWFLGYQSKDLSGDLIAGVTVGIMLIPQSMAYAMLAGLPPYMGLYASILPMLLYILWGTSPYLSVGPVAITSIYVGTSLGELSAGNVEMLIIMASCLAMFEGLFQIIMGVCRLGFIVNFISHPVLTGYITAAAITILGSQIPQILGIYIPREQGTLSVFLSIFENIKDLNIATLIIGIASMGLLIYSKRNFRNHLKSLKLPRKLYVVIPKSMPLIIVVLSIFSTWKFNLSSEHQVKIVGSLPTGLPRFSLPSVPWDRIGDLIPIAFTISLLSFLESISIGKTLAYKSGKVVRANREFLALGAANIGSALSGGYSVSDSLSRSTVNYQSGAKTKLASVITVGMVTVTVLFFMPELYYLPKAVLSSIIVVAISSLIDFKYFWRLTKLNKPDALAFAATFLAVFILGIKYGLLVGILISMILYMWVTSTPHMAVIGRLGNSEHFRNVLRHKVITYPHILMVRIDESLTFVNSKFVEEHLLQIIYKKKDLKYFLLNASNINHIDTSALETLEALFGRLKKQGVEIYLAEIKGPVMDYLIKSGFVKRFGKSKIFLSTHLALNALLDKSQDN